MDDNRIAAASFRVDMATIRREGAANPVICRLTTKILRNHRNRRLRYFGYTVTAKPKPAAPKAAVVDGGGGATR